MSDRRLQVFYSVAKHLSFTKAAEALHMTQPAVTFQVRQLEEQFNTRLFDRTHNRINLTDAGDRVYHHAKQIFEQYSRMESEVRELTGEVSGVVIVGASTTVAEYMLPSLLGAFKRKFPDVVIRLQVSNTEGIVAAVEHNAIDLGVVEGPVSNKSLMVEICRIDRLVAVLPPDHALAGSANLPVADVLKYPFITREEGSGTREVTFDYLRGAGLEPANLTVVMELGSPESIKGAIEADMGISILSRSTIDKELQLGTLTCVELEPRLERPFSFVHQKQKFRVRAIEELLDFARVYCRDEGA